LFILSFCGGDVFREAFLFRALKNIPSGAMFAGQEIGLEMAGIGFAWPSTLWLITSAVQRRRIRPVRAPPGHEDST
jgi:hypothetical protein